MQKRLTLTDRLWIDFLLKLKRGWTLRELGKVLKRDHSVIRKELARNCVSGRPYDAWIAQRLADKRQQDKVGLKLDQDPKLREWIVDHLRADWSPEQIAGRLKTYPPPHLKGKTVCHETVYQFIYHDETKHLNLYTYLRRRQPKRRLRGTRRSRDNVQIKERTSIHDRPEEIARRVMIGHWEADQMVGKRFTKSVLTVFTERKTGFTKLKKVPNPSAQENVEALISVIESLPADHSSTVKSITFDNGSENAHHYHLKTFFENLQTYFCDPYKPYQKGTVENIVGLIRQFIPKGEDLNTYTNEEIQEIEDKLNHRPRKRHNFQTALEVFKKELQLRSS